MKVLSCLANTFGFISVISPTISYISGETKEKSVLRFITMSIAQFFACMLKSDLNEIYKNTPEENAAVASAFKYVFTDFMNGKDFSLDRLSLGYYNGFCYSKESSVKAYLNSTVPDYYHPKMVGLSWPIFIEAWESFMYCAATQQIHKCTKAALDGAKVGMAVSVASETTFPLATSILTWIDSHISGDTVKIAHNEL